jgi:hypothetical protein
VTDDDGPMPLDDVLSWARWSTDILSEKYARETHEKLMAMVRELSPDWELSPKATAVVLELIDREARKRLVWEERDDAWLQRELDKAWRRSRRRRRTTDDEGPPDEGSGVEDDEEGGEG